MKAYSFYFNASDWLASPAVKQMSLAERGAYIGLLAFAWNSERPGTLPASADKVRRIAEMSADEWAESGETILEKFPLSECGTYRYNPRLLAEAGKEQVRSEKAKEYHTRKAEAGSIGGRVRAEREAAAKAKGTHTKDQWNKMLALCDAQCVRCGSKEHLQKDHIVPIYQGGSDGIDNLQPLCRTCNTSKGPENIDHRLAYFQAKPKHCLLEFQALLGDAASKTQALKEQVQVKEEKASMQREQVSASLSSQSPTPDQRPTERPAEYRYDEAPVFLAKNFKAHLLAIGYPQVDASLYLLRISKGAEEAVAKKRRPELATNEQWGRFIQSWLDNDRKNNCLLLPIGTALAPIVGHQAPNPALQVTTTSTSYSREAIAARNQVKY